MLEKDKRVTYRDEDSPWIIMDKLDWSMFAADTVSMKYPKGHVFYLQDEYSDSVYIVNSGRVAMCLCTYDGDIRVATVLDKGCTFGSQTLFDDMPHSCMAKVVSEEAYVTAINKELFKTVMKRNPKVYENLLVQSNRMNRMLLSQMALMSFERSENRVYMVLMHLANQFSRQSGDERVLQVSFTQQDLAEVTGLSRVSVANILSQLKKDGLLVKEDKRYCLTNIDMLYERIHFEK